MFLVKNFLHFLSLRHQSSQMLVYIRNTWELIKSADSTPRDARPLPDTLIQQVESKISFSHTFFLVRFQELKECIQETFKQNLTF